MEEGQPEGFSEGKESKESGKEDLLENLLVSRRRREISPSYCMKEVGRL